MHTTIEAFSEKQNAKEMGSMWILEGLEGFLKRVKSHWSCRTSIYEEGLIVLSIFWFFSWQKWLEYNQEGFITPIIRSGSVYRSLYCEAKTQVESRELASDVRILTYYSACSFDML